MKVFNEMQGYCGSIPYLAEFERQLDNEGRFEAVSYTHLDVYKRQMWSDGI